MLDNKSGRQYRAAFLKIQSLYYKAIETALEKLFDTLLPGQKACRFQIMTRSTAGPLTGQEVRISQLTTGQAGTIAAHQVSGGSDSSWYVADCQLSDGTCRASIADALCGLALTHSPEEYLFVDQF